MSIPINTALIDSLSLKIPLKEIEVIDKRLTSMTCIYYDDIDGIEVDEHGDYLKHPPKPIIVCKNGITVRFALSEIPIFDKELNMKVQTRFVNLTLSAKLLKQRYFEGINKNNIEFLYEEFMRFDVFKCTFDTFMDSSNASDTDICSNRYIDGHPEYDDLLKSVYEQTGTKKKWLHLISESENKGLAFNTRIGARPSIPFIKMYFKELELLSKSAEFYNNYLFPKYAKEIKGLTRIEVTIKNYAHKKRLEKFGILPNFKTLRELLEIKEDKLIDFLRFSVNSYVEHKPRIKLEGLSPTDHMLFQAMQNSFVHGMDYEGIIESYTKTYHGKSADTTKNQRARMRKKIYEIYSLMIFKEAKLKTKANQNAHVMDYMRFIGIKPF